MILTAMVSRPDEEFQKIYFMEDEEDGRKNQK